MCKIRKQLFELTGIDILDERKCYKSISVIIDEISKVFNKPSLLQQVEVCRLLGGGELKINEMFASLAKACTKKSNKYLSEHGTYVKPDNYAVRRYYNSAMQLNGFIQLKNKGELDKMDILQKIKENAIDIINEYREASVCKIKNKYNDSKSELLKSTETQKLIKKHKNELREELCELRCIDKDFNFSLIARYSHEGSFLPEDIVQTCLTSNEKDKLEELDNSKGRDVKKIHLKCNRLIMSLDLCENRNQIMAVLKANDLVDNNGVIKDSGGIDE